MKNKIILLIAIIAFIVGLLLLKGFLDKYPLNKYLEDENLNNENIVTGDTDEIKPSLENVLENENINMKEESGEMEVVEMTNERFEEEVLKSEKTVLIDFYADWCAPCKMMAPVVERIASENNELKVVKVNIDNEEELAIKYMVMSIPTFVVIKNGEEVNRIVGAVDKSELESLIKWIE